MTAPPLTFLAPPSFGDHLGDSSLHNPAATSPVRSTAHTASGLQLAPTVRMTRGARQAAIGMSIADADIQRCLDAPEDVSPDDNTPSRTRFRRGDLVVLAAADGMVLRVGRRRR